ncbi:MAG: hypothetical protein ACRDIY_06690 [Chloroflexota bacterium]
MPERPVAPRRPAVRFSKDYELGDVLFLYRRRAWTSWAELVAWLRAEGPTCGALTPGEVARMVADFSVLDDEHVPFIRNGGTAYEVAQAHRRTSAVLEALKWIDQTQAKIRGAAA